jgi:tRNA threonylcarbamoyladenosine biosynthesis protein TsaB
MTDLAQKPFIILAFDTTGLQDSISLTIEKKGKLYSTCSKILPQGGSQRQSSFLVSDLQDLLRGQGYGFRDVTVLCTLTGPGSFTGIRIGLATAQGLWIANGCQLFAPTTLDLLIYMARKTQQEGNKSQCPILAVIDSKRGDYFAQKGSTHEGDSPHVMTLQEVEAFIHEGGYVISSGSIDALDVQIPQAPLAESLIEFYQHHRESCPEASSLSLRFQELSPCYIRTPDFKKKNA